MYFIDYEFRSNEKCSPHRDQIATTLSEAKIRCNADPLCAMFFDDGGRGKYFSLCDHNAATQPCRINKDTYICSWNTRVYIKQGNGRDVLYHCTTNVETIYDKKNNGFNLSMAMITVVVFKSTIFMLSSGKNHGTKPTF